MLGTELLLFSLIKNPKDFRTCCVTSIFFEHSTKFFPGHHQSSRYTTDLKLFRLKRVTTGFVIFVYSHGAVFNPKRRHTNSHTQSFHINRKYFRLFSSIGIRKYASWRSRVAMKHPLVTNFRTVRISSILK